MSFNLPAPPNFQGFDEQGPLVRYERRLPHWRQDGATYFVTFNLADAVPANQQRELNSIRREWEHKTPHPRSEDQWLEYAKSMFRWQERIMDAGFGACWFANREYATHLKDTILRFHEQRYEIGCFVVMANHCHLTMRPFTNRSSLGPLSRASQSDSTTCSAARTGQRSHPTSLETELGAIKRTTSRFLHNNEQTTGALWQQESFDRIIRDEEHLWRVVQYIGRNPQAAGIPPAKWVRWLSPTWRTHGWRFEDEVGG